MPELPDVQTRHASPLASYPPIAEQRHIREVPFVSKINLRGDRSDELFSGGIKSVTGLELPARQGDVAKANDVKALWLGPDEWLIVSETIASGDLATRFTKALSGVHASVVDVSAGRTIVALSGEDSRTILAKGCGLDLHPRAFPPGHCAQTHLARAVVILEHLDKVAVPMWHIYVANSFATYLADWLIDARRN